jgi:hypothetical protein
VADGSDGREDGDVDAVLVQLGENPGRIDGERPALAVLRVHHLEPGRQTGDPLLLDEPAQVREGQIGVDVVEGRGVLVVRRLAAVELRRRIRGRGSPSRSS